MPGAAQTTDISWNWRWRGEIDGSWP